MSYKMKGFSGFKPSPAKAKGGTLPTDKKNTKKNPKETKDSQPAQGSMTYPNDDRITALTEKDMKVKEAISNSADGTEKSERKKLILQKYMRTGSYSAEDKKYMEENK